MIGKIVATHLYAMLAAVVVVMLAGPGRADDGGAGCLPFMGHDVYSNILVHARLTSSGRLEGRTTTSFMPCAQIRQGIKSSVYRDARRFSVEPELGGSQYVRWPLPPVSGTSTYRIIFESERADAMVRLVGPTKSLSASVDLPVGRWEWSSDRPHMPGKGAALELQVTTLTSWERIAHAFRDQYFLDAAGLDRLELLQIPRSSDARALFRQFKDRFVPTDKFTYQFVPDDLDAIAAARSGDCKALSFLLLNLFRWNGIDAELVFTGRRRPDPEDVFSFRTFDHALVYVPGLDRYFDPMIFPGWEQMGIDRYVRAGARFHVADASRPPGNDATIGCRDFCFKGVGAPQRPPN